MKTRRDKDAISTQEMCATRATIKSDILNNSGPSNNRQSLMLVRKL